MSNDNEAAKALLKSAIENGYTIEIHNLQLTPFHDRKHLRLSPREAATQAEGGRDYDSEWFSAFCAGETAAVANQPRDSNPHTNGNAYHEGWDAGWTSWHFDSTADQLRAAEQARDEADSQCAVLGEELVERAIRAVYSDSAFSQEIIAGYECELCKEFADIVRRIEHKRECPLASTAGSALLAERDGLNDLVESCDQFYLGDVCIHKRVDGEGWDLLKEGMLVSRCHKSALEALAAWQQHAKGGGE
jgi:hypothetical protein